MLHRRRFMLAVLPIASSLLGCSKTAEEGMTEIRFDLGMDIVDTARASGVPTFQVSETAGLVDYSINGIPKDVTAHYMRPGYEISWRSIFAFTMYADRDISPNLLVETVALQFDSRAIGTHSEAQALAEQTVAQFRRGNWQRYSDPELEVLLTGRSSLLDEHGSIGGGFDDHRSHLQDS